jgi:hypothetical protein
MTTLSTNLLGWRTFFSVFILLRFMMRSHHKSFFRVMAMDQERKMPGGGLEKTFKF